MCEEDDAQAEMWAAAPRSQTPEQADHNTAGKEFGSEKQSVRRSDQQVCFSRENQEWPRGRRGRLRREMLVVGSLVGSFCCAGAAIKMRLDPTFWLPWLLRFGLAFLAICGFAQYMRQLSGSRQIRIIVATIAATAISTAVATAAAVIAVTTAAAMYVRSGVSYSVRTVAEGARPALRRRYELLGLGVDILELGALLLQMILMTHWVFGEFSVIPVMTTMGMMFALLHNVHSYAEVLHLTDGQDPVVWWEDAF